MLNSWFSPYPITDNLFSDICVRKAELIRGIHETQIARLSATYFNIEATAMMTLVQSLADYMEMAASSDPDDKAAGGPVSFRILAHKATFIITCVFPARKAGHGEAFGRHENDRY